MTREPWDQRLDEPSDAYRQFLWWRDQVPRPPPSDPRLAASFAWSDRAAAWDEHRSIPTRFEDQAEVAARALTETACLYARRLLGSARSNATQELSPKDTVALVKGVVQIQQILVQMLAGRSPEGGTEEAEKLVDALPPERYSDFLDILEEATKKLGSGV